MSGDIFHNIFYQYDGEEFANHFKDIFAGKRYNVTFNLHKLQNANATNISNSGVSILLLTPDSYDIIRSGRHLDLNVLFPNPDFSIAILFHVGKTKDEIATFLSSRIRDSLKWKLLDFQPGSGYSSVVIDTMDVVEKLEKKCKADPSLQKFQVWTREGVKPHQQIILIFTKPVDDHLEVKVVQEWDGLKATAERLNPMTYSFSIGDVEPGDNNIEVFINDTTYGRAVLHVLHMEPKMEQVTKFLHNIVDPVKLLCQCLHISATRENLDQKLVDLLSKNTSSVSHIFQEFDWERYGDSKSNLELPTLLHFGAKYGFQLFCLELLKLPGGKHALKMKNKDGFLPRQIAQKEGFDHLELLLRKKERENIYFMPQPICGFKGKDPGNIQKSQTLPTRGRGTHVLGSSMNELRSQHTSVQQPAPLSKTTVDRTRFFSDSAIEEGITQESLRLHRKMTKVTAPRGEEEQHTRHIRTRINSLPELPELGRMQLGRLQRKERPYDTLED